MVERSLARRQLVVAMSVAMVVGAGSSRFGHGAGQNAIPSTSEITAPQQTTDLSVVVIGIRNSEAGKQLEQPLMGAKVLLWTADAEEIEKITNSQGIARFATVPRGKVHIQVAAHEWKTAGRELELRWPEETARMELEEER